MCVLCVCVCVCVFVGREGATPGPGGVTLPHIPTPSRTPHTRTRSPQDTFAQMLRDAGFKAVTYENLTQGVVAIHSGFKL